MKKLIILFLFLSNFTFGQTNYNTIIAPKIDSVNQQINLRIQTKERFETMGNLFFAAGVISTVVMYNLEPKTTLLFIVPLGLCVSGVGFMAIASKYEN